MCPAECTAIHAAREFTGAYGERQRQDVFCDRGNGDRRARIGRDHRRGGLCVLAGYRTGGRNEYREL